MKSLKQKNIFKESEESGQALFETVAFIPFFVAFIMIFLKVSSAISGSINQQKALRSYFFRRTQHNSKTPSNNVLTNIHESDGQTKITMVVYGWAQRLEEGAKAYSPCYNLPSVFSNADDEDCDTPPTGGVAGKIRVGTAFGLCGNEYEMPGGSGNFVDTAFSNFSGKFCGISK